MAKAAKKAATKTSRVPAAPEPEAQTQSQPEQKAAPAVELRSKPEALHNGVVLAEQRINHFVNICEPAVTPDDIVRPEYWCHHAAKFTGLAQITVINRLKGWEATLRVIEIGKGFAKVVPLSFTEWKTVSRDSDEVNRMKAEFSIEERPDGYRVKNAQGDQVVAGLLSKDDAEQFIKETVASMTAEAA